VGITTTHVPLDYTDEKYVVSRMGQRLQGAELATALAARDPTLSYEEKVIAKRLMQGLCQQARILAEAKNERDNLYISSFCGRQINTYPIPPQACTAEEGNNIPRASNLFIQAVANYEAKVRELLNPRYVAIINAHRKGIWEIIEAEGMDVGDDIKEMFMTKHSHSSLHESSPHSSHHHPHIPTQSEVEDRKQREVIVSDPPSPSSSTHSSSQRRHRNVILRDELRNRDHDEESSSSSSSSFHSLYPSSFTPVWERDNETLQELRKTNTEIFVSSEDNLADKLTDNQSKIVY
jgi:hypothetical protein